MDTTILWHTFFLKLQIMAYIAIGIKFCYILIRKLYVRNSVQVLSVFIFLLIIRYYILNNLKIVKCWSYFDYDVQCKNEIVFLSTLIRVLSKSVAYHLKWANSFNHPIPTLFFKGGGGVGHPLTTNWRRYLETNTSKI